MCKKRFSKLICILIVSSLSTPIFAQELRPLSEVFETSANPYKYTRCAGYYLSILLWAGEDRLGTITTEETKTAYTTLGFMAVTTMVGDGMGDDFKKLSEVFLRDAQRISYLYIDRYQRNYAAVGQAFAEDPLILGDMKLCTELVRLIYDGMEQRGY